MRYFYRSAFDLDLAAEIVAAAEFECEDDVEISRKEAPAWAKKFDQRICGEIGAIGIHHFKTIGVPVQFQDSGYLLTSVDPGKTFESGHRGPKTTDLSWTPQWQLFVALNDVGPPSAIWFPTIRSRITLRAGTVVLWPAYGVPYMIEAAMERRFAIFTWLGG